MDKNIKKYEHNPPHVFCANTKYFITASIYNGSKLLASDESKLVLLKYIEQSVKHYNWKLEEWVILDNHYHLMLESNEKPGSLGKIIGNIHKFSSNWIRKNVKNSAEQSKIWYNYWDKYLTYESSYYARLNYIWLNPVKHGYVDNPSKWKFGSYYHKHNDEHEYMDKLIKKYPCGNLKIEDTF